MCSRLYLQYAVPGRGKGVDWLTAEAKSISGEKSHRSGIVVQAGNINRVDHAQQRARRRCALCNNQQRLLKTCALGLSSRVASTQMRASCG
ncbi:unnamed protein product [Lampetra planeri]